jgi:TolA-binding protein
LAVGVLVSGLLAGAAFQAAAQVSLDNPPLDEHDAKRLDRIEKAVKELRAIVFQGRETGAPVQIEPADTEANLQRLTDHLNDVDQTLAKLTGELEVTRHDLDQAHHDIADLRASNAALKEEVDGLAKTVQSLTPPPAPPPAAGDDLGGAPPSDGLGGPQPPAAAAPATPSQQFAAAETALEQGDMAAAEAGFKTFIAQNGDGPRGPEARYDLARALIARHDWPDAATADIGAIRGWPHTRWAPAAVLDLSRALVAMGKPQDACETLGELRRRYHDVAPEILENARRLRVTAQCA